jgi:hypothetical protein
MRAGAVARCRAFERRASPALMTINEKNSQVG